MAVSKIEVTNHHHLHILVHLHHHHYVHHIHPPPLSPPWSPSSPSSLSWFMVSFVYLVARCVIEAVSRSNHLISNDLSVPTHTCILSNVHLSAYSAPSPVVSLQSVSIQRDKKVSTSTQLYLNKLFLYRETKKFPTQLSAIRVPPHPPWFDPSVTWKVIIDVVKQGSFIGIRVRRLCISKIDKTLTG